MRIINCWSTTSKFDGLGQPGDLVLMYRKKDGIRRVEVKKFQWYFFIDKNDKNLGVAESAKRHRLITSYDLGKKYIKLNLENKDFKDKSVIDFVKALHVKGVPTYEADVGPAKRFMLDGGYKIEDFDKINLMYIDIETDDRSGVIEYEGNGGTKRIKAKDRILSICLMDRKGKEYYFTHGIEKTLLKEFSDFLYKHQVDMLVGWNSKDFDIPYIIKRMRENKLSSTYMRNILHEDMMRRVQYFYSKDPEARQNITSYSLENISQYFLKEGKTEFDGLIYDLWSDDPAKLKEYNVQDCRLLKKLEDKLGLIELTYQMFQMCGCTAQNWSMIKNIDNFILIEANKEGIHLPTNPAYLRDYEESVEIEEYLGAFVLTPDPGYYENVYDLDFKSLYPNIIRTFNISPETYSPEPVSWSITTPGTDKDGITHGKAYFRAAEGVIPRKIALLLEEREKIRKNQKNHDKSSREWKDLNVKQLVVKELANSIYGVIGNPYFRGFNVNMAEAITATGQYLIKHLKEVFESKGRRVIYGDTDSIFTILAPGENIEDVLKETNAYLKGHLEENFRVRDCTIQIALDKKLDKFFIEAKKKYAGEIDGKLSITGLECIKRDNITIATRMQKDLIKKIFQGKDPETIEKWLQNEKKALDEGSIDLKDITIYKKIGRSTYKNIPIQVRIVQELKERTKGKKDYTAPGTIIPYVVTSSDGGINGIHTVEFKGDFDKKYYWDNLIYPPLERMLKHIYPDTDWKQYYTPKPVNVKVVKEAATKRKGKKELRTEIETQKQ